MNKEVDEEGEGVTPDCTRKYKVQGSTSREIRLRSDVERATERSKFKERNHASREFFK